MFDCAYQPEPEPEPVAIPISSNSHNAVWIVATLLVLAIGLAATLGTLASDYVMS